MTLMIDMDLMSILMNWYAIIHDIHCTAFMALVSKQLS